MNTLRNAFSRLFRLEDHQLFNNQLLDELPDHEEHLLPQQPHDPLRTFHPFLRLPREIRRAIWRATFPARLVVFDSSSHYELHHIGRFSARDLDPATAFNAPSPLFYLPDNVLAHPKCFSEAVHGCKIIVKIGLPPPLQYMYFWPERDTTAFRLRELEALGQPDPWYDADFSGLRTIQSVRIDGPWWFKFWHPQQTVLPYFIRPLRSLESLRELELMLPPLCLDYQLIDTLNAAFRSMRDQAHPNSPIPVISFSPRPIHLQIR